MGKDISHKIQEWSAHPSLLFEPKKALLGPTLLLGLHPPSTLQRVPILGNIRGTETVEALLAE
jgi:hypothetical protein